MSRARVLLTTAALAASFLAPLTIAGSAVADPAPLTGFSDLLAVPAEFGGPAHLVLASGNDVGGGIEVLDAAGANPRRVPDVTQVRSLALAPDGRVWATVNTGSIVSFSPDDPELSVDTHTVDVPCLYDLAVASDGKIWFTGGCTNGEGGLYVLDPAQDDHVTEITTGLLARPLDAGLSLENGYQNPDIVVVGEDAFDGWVDFLSVDGTTATELNHLDEDYLGDLTVADDGLTALVAPAYSDPELLTIPTTIGAPVTTVRTFPSDEFVDAVGISPTNAYVATGSYAANHFRTFGPSSNLPLRVYTPATTYSIGDRGLAWLGNVLATVTMSFNSPEVHLHGDATDLPSTLTLTAPSGGTVNKAFTITGTLTSRGTPLKSVPLTVSRTDGAGTVSAGTATTRSDGSYRISVTPPNGETVKYTVKYAGDDQHQPTSATHSMWITRLATFLSISTEYSAYWYHHYATITVHLGTTYKSRYVRLYANQAGIGKKQIAGGLVDANGKFVRTFRLSRNTSFSAYFAGDLRRAPKTVSKFVHTAAIPTMTLKDYYATDSAGYRLYHKSQYIHLSAHVDPNKAGQCVYFDAQYKKDGKWHDIGSSDCFNLGSGSNAAAYFDVPHVGVIGRQYRFGFYYNGDSYNMGAGSQWRYAKVTA